MEWNSALWEEFAKYCHDDDEIKKVLSVGFDGQHVLDAGCATGRLTTEIAQYATDVVGIDSSSEMIEYARSNNAKNNVKYEVADITSLRFPDHEFDTALCAWCLHHVENLETAINELSRVSKKRIAILEPLDNNDFDLIGREAALVKGIAYEPEVSSLWWAKLLTQLNILGYQWTTDVVETMHMYPDIRTAARNMSYALGIGNDDIGYVAGILEKRYGIFPQIKGTGLLISAARS